MFDIWWGNIEVTTLVILIAVIIAAPMQALLCFKAKKRAVRLFPVIFFFVCGLICFLLSRCTTWTASMMFDILTIFSLIFLIGCGIGWIPALFRKRLTKR